MKNFVVTRTPHRISFLGGGSDIKSFYKDNEGLSLSTTIKHYVYVGVKRHSKFFDEKYRIVYSTTELRNNLKDIKNDIVRETLKHCKFKDPIYINSTSDLPSSSGLGSSSAFTVGLLKAIYYLMGIKKNNKDLAKEACHIEINRIKKPIGKQDQYACSVGGVNYLKFQANDSVSIKKNLKTEKFINKILSNSLLIWTGISRPSEIILSKQVRDLKKGLINTDTLKIKIICEKFYKEASKYNGKNFNELNNFFIESLNESWNIKKTLNKDISNNKIEKLIKKIYTLTNDNLGLKLLGAGAGGFIFVTGIKNVKQFQKKLSQKKVFSLKVNSDSEGSVFL
tara:strand:+ start:34 stop:1047 length:1014 start_codon:yes stop_codon:yes gene_type:complete